MVKKFLCLAGFLFGLILWSNLSYAYEMAGAQRVKGTVTAIVRGGSFGSGHPYEDCQSMTVKFTSPVTNHQLISVNANEKLSVKGLIVFNVTSTGGAVDFYMGNTVIFHSLVAGAVGSGYITDVMFTGKGQPFKVTTIPTSILITIFYKKEVQ